MKKILPLLLLITACATTVNERRVTTEATAHSFFENYSTRADWLEFQDLYSEDLIFEDVVFRYTFNKQAFIDFYNWPDSLLSKHPDHPEVMVLENLAFTDSTAIGKGYFTPFYYEGELYADTTHMRFVIAIEVNKEGKINKHTDFIEYPAEFMLVAAKAALADSVKSQ